MDSSKIEDLVLSGDVTITVQMVTEKWRSGGNW
jgi:hypothetical protein